MTKKKQSLTKEQFIQQLTRMNKEEIRQYILNNGKQKLVTPYYRIIK